VTLAEQHKPDVVVIDINVPDLNGLEAVRKIRKSLPKTEIAVLTLHFSDQLLHDIVEAGARAYIMKPDAADDLVAAVEALSNHFSYFTSRASDRVPKRLLRQDDSDADSPDTVPQPAYPPRARDRTAIGRRKEQQGSRGYVEPQR
jgi:DNA-binding NarL/FixJ family response regulator